VRISRGTRRAAAPGAPRRLRIEGAPTSLCGACSRRRRRCRRLDPRRASRSRMRSIPASAPASTATTVGRGSSAPRPLCSTTGGVDAPDEPPARGAGREARLCCSPRRRRGHAQSIARRTRLEFSGSPPSALQRDRRSRSAGALSVGRHFHWLAARARRRSHGSGGAAHGVLASDATELAGAQRAPTSRRPRHPYTATTGAVDRRFRSGRRPPALRSSGPRRASASFEPGRSRRRPRLRDLYRVARQGERRRLLFCHRRGMSDNPRPQLYWRTLLGAPRARRDSRTCLPIAGKHC